MTTVLCAGPQDLLLNTGCVSTKCGAVLTEENVLSQVCDQPSSEGFVCCISGFISGHVLMFICSIIRSEKKNQPRLAKVHGVHKTSLQPAAPLLLLTAGRAGIHRASLMLPS